MEEVLVTATVMLTLYKVLELYAKRKERNALIEKIDFTKDTTVNISQIIGHRDYDIHKRSVLWGCLLVGVGLGVLAAYLLTQCVGLYHKNTELKDIYEQITAIYTSCVFVFGGIGLLVSYFINKKEQNK